MVRAELKAKAKSQIKGNIGKLFLIGLVEFAVLLPFIVMLFASLSSFMNEIALATMAGVELTAVPSLGIWFWIGLVGMALLVPALVLGYSKLYLGLTRGETPTVGGLFKGFSSFGKALWLDLIASFFILLWFGIPCIVGFFLTAQGSILILAGSVAAGVILSILGIILLIASLVILIIKLLAYCQINWILADNPNVTAWQAFKSSVAMMKGHKWEAFVLDLSFLGWILLGILTAGILFIWLTPYINATYANYYLALKGKNAPSAAIEQ